MSALIATLTMNPTIDVAAQAQRVRPTHKLRTFAERQDPGGGGVNVASVVHALGGRSLALIMAGGASGRLLEELLDDAGVARRTVAIAGRTRTSHTVVDASNGYEYRFIAQGPTVTESEWTAMLDTIGGVEAGWLIASGSLPPGVPEDFYARLAAAAGHRGSRFVLDTSGPALRAGLAGGGVELVKSSLTELESVAGRKLADEAAQQAAATHIVRSGRARMVALTLGEKGALLVWEEGALRLPALDVVVNGTVGAGDSFLAGMVMALAEGREPADAFAWGVAAGAAAVTVPGTAHPERNTVERLRGLILVPHSLSANGTALNV
ncbi:1-phosphofructokinase family hexose kinase [Lichenicoccus sp.]|uniref:1-phosphofructokinase family hexose kinase n=1 Tax=Lichenicoccus sp. TaxID=2781899 RepID=UPI003D114950